MKRLAIYLTLISLFLPIVATGGNIPWNQWVRELKQEAVEKGIDPYFFDQVFRGIRPNKRVMRFDRRQPERRLTFMKYRNTRADAFRIKLGKREMRKHRAMVNEIGSEYGVDPCFIIALWGIETSYGRYMGDFPVIKSLATLAYDKRRAKFFRKELLLALEILQAGHVPPGKFKGEWAGGSGHPQFLPSSWHRYAVDYNQDGRKDIWTTLSDVFASIANYLATNGWQAGQPWAVPVRGDGGIAESEYGYKNSKTVGQWRELGIVTKNSLRLPSDQTQAWLVRPHGGPTFLVFKNFRVIMTYNNSTYYAGTVGYMADKICARPLYAQSRR